MSFVSVFMNLFGPRPVQKRVLLVHDNAEYLNAAGGRLGARGMYVTTVPFAGFGLDAQQLYSFLKEGRFHLVAISYANEQRTIEHIKFIRARFPKVAIVLLTEWEQKVSQEAESLLKTGGAVCASPPKEPIYPIEAMEEAADVFSQLVWVVELSFKALHGRL